MYKGGEYTVYVKDKLGNTTTKTIQVTSISQSNDKKDDDKKDDSNKVEDNKTNDNSTGGNNNYSGKTDGTESPDIIPQAGATLSIAILIVTLISAYVGYRKFRKINY